MKNRKIDGDCWLQAASYQWYIIQDEAEGGRSFCEVLTDLPGHELSLSDQLASIKPSLGETTCSHFSQFFNILTIKKYIYLQASYLQQQTLRPLWW